jgi:hypothetical protein
LEYPLSTTPDSGPSGNARVTDPSAGGHVSPRRWWWGCGRGRGS